MVVWARIPLRRDAPAQVMYEAKGRLFFAQVPVGESSFTMSIDGFATQL
jgi:hypothetical protein